MQDIHTSKVLECLIENWKWNHSIDYSQGCLLGKPEAEPKG